MKPAHYREPSGACVFCANSDRHPYSTYCNKYEVFVDTCGCCDDYKEDKVFEVQE
jgi:hypothetical protein